MAIYNLQRVEDGSGWSSYGTWTFNLESDNEHIIKSNLSVMGQLKPPILNLKRTGGTSGGSLTTFSCDFYIDCYVNGIFVGSYRYFKNHEPISANVFVQVEHYKWSFERIYIDDIWSSTTPTTVEITYTFRPRSSGYMPLQGEHQNTPDIYTILGYISSLTPYALTTNNNSKAILNAPPSCTYTQIEDISSAATWIQGISLARTTISDAVARYGGNIVNIELKIGNFSGYISGNGNIDVLVKDSGVITPQLVVTDSRGQKTTYVLNSITVNSYNKPIIEEIELERHVPSGNVDETQVYISTTIKQSVIDGNRLGVPTVKVSNNDISDKIEWYNEPTHETIYTSTTAANKRIYGVVDSAEVFATGSTYAFTFTISDSYSLSDVKNEVLPSIYVTMDFQAGGKEIAFGEKADDSLTNHPNGLFKCAMDMTLKGNFDIYMDIGIVLADCTITDSGTALSVTDGADTGDGRLAQAVIDAFDYATAKEILEV